MTPPQVTAVVVDDHPVFRRGLVALLAEIGVRVVAEASTAADAESAARREHPDVILMDLHLPDASGVEATRRVLAAHPDCRVLMITMDGGDSAIIAALRAGARGYMLKEAAAESIAEAISTLVAGGLVLDPALVARVPALLSAASPATTTDDLTHREAEILDLVGDGLSNSAIARRLFLAEKTVRNNVTSLLAKTHRSDRIALGEYSRARRG
jgi:DNA-binding NarL/FixJ family response regulator